MDGDGPRHALYGVYNLVGLLESAIMKRTSMREINDNSQTSPAGLSVS